MATSPTTAEQVHARRWAALAILLIANIMNLMDVTIVIIGLPSIQRSLHATAAELEWVVAAYVIALALGLLPFGRLGDILGRKRLFLYGVLGFTLTSALCGLAPNIGMLIAARALQGLTAAVMAPQVMAIIHVTFPAEEKGKAFSLFSLSTGLASVLGSIAGGVLISADIAGLGWRPVFLVNVPIGLFAALAGRAIITEVQGHRSLRNDIVGIILFGITILLLIFPLVEGHTLGWPAWTFAMIAASPIVTCIFRAWERHRNARQVSQLLPLSLLDNRHFRIGALMSLLYFSAVPGMFFMFAMFVQSGFGLPPLPAGLVGIPFPIGVVTASLVCGRFGNRFLLPRLVAGSLVLSLGIFFLRLTVAGVGDTLNVWAFLPSFFIAGAGLGVSVGPLFQTILSGVNLHDAGAGAGALQAFQQVGGALGVAVVGGVFFATLASAQAHGAASHTAYVSAADRAFYYEIVVFILVAALAPLLKHGAVRQEVSPTPIAAAAES